MGTEGHNSPRDVVDEKQKHPWEVFPEDEASAKLSEKKRKEIKREKAREGRKTKIANVKKWIKTHTLLIVVIIVVTALLIGAGVFAYFKLKETNDKNNEPEDDPTSLVYEFVDDLNIEDNYLSADVFAFAEETVGKTVALVGVDTKNPDASKVEDNMDAYIKTLDSDYKKLYYRIYTTYLISKYDFPERAKFLLEGIDLEGNKLDKKQLYVYYKSYSLLYSKTQDVEKEKEYADRLINEFNDEQYYTIDKETGKVIINEELSNKYKDAYKVVGGSE